MKNISKLLTVTVVVLLVAIPVAAQPERADPTFSLRSMVSALVDLADALLMRFQPGPRKLGMGIDPNGATEDPVVRFQPGPCKLGYQIQPNGESIPGEDQGSEPTPVPGGAGGVDAAAAPNG